MTDKPLLKYPGDWRTLLIAVLVYGGWLITVFSHRFLPFWATFILLTWFGAWYLSLAHEIVHAHPFTNQKLNALLGSFSVTVWVPLLSFQRDHLEHHNTVLTHPRLDSESYYSEPEKWRSANHLWRFIGWANRTLLFRLTIWSMYNTIHYFFADFWRAVRGVGNARTAWLLHVPGLFGVWFVVVQLAKMPTLEYLAGGVFASHSLNMMRSFAEHKSVPNEQTRTAMIKAGPAMRLLMLNNNLHVAHHDEPWMPWYLVPEVATRLNGFERAENIEAHYKGGYWELIRRFTFKPYDQPVYGESVVGPAKA